METGLRNRVAIVAASSQGIGLATAEAFAAEGCRVAMCARNTETLASRCRAYPATAQRGSVSRGARRHDAAAVHSFVEGVVAKFGAVDICVTNAGGPPAKGFLATTDADWRKAIDMNFMSTVYLRP